MGLRAEVRVALEVPRCAAELGRLTAIRELSARLPEPWAVWVCPAVRAGGAGRFLRADGAWFWEGAAASVCANALYIVLTLVSRFKIGWLQHTVDFMTHVEVTDKQCFGRDCFSVSLSCAL